MVSSQLYAMQISQLEKAKGELRALVALHYDTSSLDKSKYKEVKNKVEEFISELEDICG